MIKRREFGKTLAAAGVAGVPQVALAQSGRARTPKKNLLMHVGGDYHAVAGGPRADMTAKANLDYNLRHGRTWCKKLVKTPQGSSLRLHDLCIRKILGGDVQTRLFLCLNLCQKVFGLFMAIMNLFAGRFHHFCSLAQQMGKHLCLREPV